MNNKTYAPNAKTIEKKWHLIDAQGKVLGKVATEIAKILSGKNKPQYAPNALVNDKVVVINAEKIRVTGKKMTDKIYYTHTMFPGGLRSINLEDLLEKHPTEALRKAVMGMLPKNKLRTPRIKSLYLYKGAEHPHAAQLGK